LPRPWADGTRMLRLSPDAFIRRLASLIPAPGRNLTRYHGVLAAASPWRAEVISSTPGADELHRPPARFVPCRSAGEARPRRVEWAELLRRTWLVDVLRCARCGSRRVVLASITTPDAIDAILTHLDLRPRPPPHHADLLTRPVQVTSQVR